MYVKGSKRNSNLSSSHEIASDVKSIFIEEMSENIFIVKISRKDTFEKLICFHNELTAEECMWERLKIDKVEYDAMST